jgi:lantibiotic leader peptide-processing serine protease
LKAFKKYILVFILPLCLIISTASPSLASEVFNSKKTYFSVLFQANAIPTDFESEMERIGGEVIYTVPEIGFAQVRLDNQSFYKLKNLKSVYVASPSISWTLPEVERIQLSDQEIDTMKEEQNALNQNYSYFWPIQWDIKQVTNNGASYELGTGSHNVVVGIIDTGIDTDHFDLVRNIMPGSKNFVPQGGFRGTEPAETGDINAYEDINGHGTHVAGSIAANGFMIGVAPNIGIRSYRVFGNGSAESAWIYKAMVAAANDGVDVISMSLGGYDIIGQVFYTDPVTGEKIALGNDIADFIAYKRVVKYVNEKGSVIVAAGGNDGLNATNKKAVTNFLNENYGGEGFKFVGAGFEMPGTIPGVITVSATGPTEELSLYSNYGPGFIDIAAPGGDTRLYYEYLLSGRMDEYLAQRIYYYEFCLSTYIDDRWAFMVGTSMATPKVSAVVALLIDKHGKLSTDKISHLLYSSGVKEVKGNEKKYYGKGHLSAFNALE